MIITRKDAKYSVECLKYAKLGSGERIYLFKNNAPIMNCNYIVAVRKDADTMFFKFFQSIKFASQAYIENLCNYA